MKKNIKRTFSSIMAAAMIATCAGVGTLAVNAEDVSINHGTSSADNHSHAYEAYQIFKGSKSGSSLIDIEWGDGVDGSKVVQGILEAVSIAQQTNHDARYNGFEVFEGLTYDSTKPNDSAKKIANILSENSGDKFKTDSVAMFNLSKIIARCLDSTKAIPEKSGANDTITFGDVGYYLIKDAAGSPEPTDSSDTTNYAPTAYLLKVIDSTTTSVSIKADTPSIDKKIVENGATVDANTASIGDTITYRFDSKVPKMDGYNKYYFIIYDTMDVGITYNNDLAITIDGVALTAGKDYFVTTGESADNAETKDVQENLKIVFHDFLQYKDRVGKKIVVTYNGILNKNATIGNIPNENTVYLQYSNNPNFVYDYNDNEKPDEPGTVPPEDPDNPDAGKKEPVGTTPDHKVKTYTTAIKIKKVDENNKALSGAKFKITGDNITKATIVTKDTFTENDEGTYYKLTTGYYTTVIPTDETKLSYVTKEDSDEYQMYALSTVTESTTTESEKYYYEGFVGTDGYLYLTGLNAGNYTITETKAPDNYNTLSSDINITISADTSKTDVWYASGDNVTIDNGEVVVKIVNTKGTMLPTTGGIGTTIFYVSGSALLVGAAAMFVSKKRKKSE